MAEQIKPASMHSKFSSRVVVLKTVLESEEWVGRRVLVGGWVKSSKEVIKKDPEAHAPEPPITTTATDVQTASAEPLATRDVSCSEILQTKIPFIRSIIKIFGGNTYSARDRLDGTTASTKPQAHPPSTLFLQIGDGSCATSLLVVVESSLAPPSILLPIGTCIVAEGELKHSTFDTKHAIELIVEKIHHIGTVESDKYPLSKKRVPLNALREFSHLRPRTTTVATIMRIRSALNLGAHTFLQNQGFLCVHLPVLASADSQPDKFNVTTTSLNTKREDQSTKPRPEGVSLEAVKAAAREKSKIVEDLKRTESNKEAVVAATEDLRKTLELASRLESIREKRCDENASHLAISGRLHLESYACCLRNVYDFGPRFRHVKTESPKQVAEMWTVEIEMAFSELEDAMNCAEDFFKFLCRWVLEKCSDDMKFVLKRMDRTSADRLHLVISSSFERITYTEALNVLKKVRDTKKVETKLEWGLALTTEQLSFLAEEVYKSPVIIYNYPKQVKPFYARLNTDKRTVAAFDIIVPKIGTLVSGSQNEERLSVLSPRLNELGLVGEDYERYLDLRRHGTVNHSGFSFAFDLMVLLATGLADVRDVIPFPTIHGKASN